MLIINVEKRIIQGKGTSRRLFRLENKFPAIIYGGDEAPIQIQLDNNLLMNLNKKEDFFNKILILVINEKKIKVKVQAMQKHPFKPRFIHIDFIRV